MVIGVFVDDSRIRGIDLSDPQYGNPGVGGTPFCFAMLLYYYKKYYSNAFIRLYHVSEVTVWPRVDSVSLVPDVYAAAKEAKKDNCECFLFRFGIESSDLYDLLDKLELKGIGWEHNFIDYKKMQDLKNHRFFVKTVFVGWAQYYKYLDHDAIEKCCVIENMLNTDYIKEYSSVYNKTIIYAGQISELKGFGYFIKAWKKISSEIPGIQLYIMGGGKLYNKDSVLGPLGLAEKNYEESIARYITDDRGELMANVHLLGVIGKEKNDIFGNCRLGIVNPIGSETLCITALEMESCGLPVVSRRKGGTLYSIEEKQTGMLFGNQKEMICAIKKIIYDDSEYERLHQNGLSFVRSNFAPIQICEKWNKLFSAVCYNGVFMQERIANRSALLEDRLIYANQQIRKKLFFFPPICGWKHFLNGVFRK